MHYNISDDHARDKQMFESQLSVCHNLFRLQLAPLESCPRELGRSHLGEGALLGAASRLKSPNRYKPHQADSVPQRGIAAHFERARDAALFQVRHRS